MHVGVGQLIFLPLLEIGATSAGERSLPEAQERLPGSESTEILEFIVLDEAF